MDDFFKMDVERAVIQTMETLYLIHTSKNIETIKGRYEFLHTLIPTLKSGKSNPTYLALIQEALGRYNTIHPSSVPQDYQLNVLYNPDAFDVKEFYCISLINAIKRYCEKESEEIRALQKEAAKAKRISKMNDIIKSTLHELQSTCSSASSYQKVLIEFQALSATSTAIA